MTETTRKPAARPAAKAAGEPKAEGVLPNESVRTDTSGNPQAVSLADEVHRAAPFRFDPEQAAAAIRSYIGYRKAQLRAPRLGGSPGGPAAIAAANALGWLNELDRLATWLEGGLPSDGTVLTEEEISHWRWAKNANLAVPDAILRQLGE